ncbi:MAG: PilZ domain-containing protein [Candidatus Omnitrophota bacterium]
MSAFQSRQGQRVGIEAKAMVQIDEAMRDTVSILRQPQEIKINDISVVGIGALCPIFLPKGAILDISMSSSELNIDNSVKIKGEVRYCRPAKEDQDKLGIKFVGIDSHILERIREFVAKNKP